MPEVLEAIDRARVTTRILYVTAHPDDESSGVLTFLARGLHADVALLSVTRGEGGQNALGPEYGPRLAILRTEELLAATRQYGVQLYFTRAPDFGYSKTPEETLQVWGDTALEDMVRVIRAFRPHIIINNWGGVRGGHGHHVAAGLLTPRALEEAAKKSDDEVAWLWESMLVLNVARGNVPDTLPIPSDQISPLWGKSYNELGLEGFVNHRTQGIVGFRTSPFFRAARSLVVAKGDKQSASRMLARPLAELATNPIYDKELEEADRSLVAAREAAMRLDWPAAVRALADAGRRVASVREYLREVSDPAESRLRFELTQVAPRIDAALASAAGVRILAQATRGELVAGETFSVRVEWQRRADVPLELGKPQLVLPEGWSVAKEDAESGGAARFTVAIPPDARPAAAFGSGVEPWPAPLVHARITGTVEGHAFEVRSAATAMRLTSTRADTVPLALVPAVTLAPEPRQFVIAQNRPPKELELLVRVRHYGTQAANITAGVEAPPGWRVSSPKALPFTGPGDQFARFAVNPPARPAAGSHELKAYAQRDAQKFQTSLEPLPTLPTRQWSEPAVTSVRIFQLTVPFNLRVGYVAAENDPMPEALRQIGVQVELLDEIALAFGDLSRFDAIAIGIRAYELRNDLGRANQRLLDYAAAGGTLVVQYQRDSDWTHIKPAPYPASVGSPTVRVSVEDSPVRFLAPAHPVLNFPNKITQEDFTGWVQERGLYFWSQFDARYQPILGMRDPGEQENTGGLVYARHGKGVYIYTGLSFFRQLPDGIPGAYRLFVNLLSQSKQAPAPKAASARKRGR